MPGGPTRRTNSGVDEKMAADGGETNVTLPILASSRYFRCKEEEDNIKLENDSRNTFHTHSNVI